jgi:hypothetical protein
MLLYAWHPWAGLSVHSPAEAPAEWMDTKLPRAGYFSSVVKDPDPVKRFNGYLLNPSSVLATARVVALQIIKGIRSSTPSSPKVGWLK